MSFPLAYPFALVCLTALAGAQGVKLSGTFPTQLAGDAHAFRISPDGLHVAYNAVQDELGKHELYVTSIEGGGVVKISPPLVSGGRAYTFEFTPDGSRVVFLAEEQARNRHEIFSAPRDGSEPAVKLNAPLGNPAGNGSTFVAQLNITADGERVLFLVDPYPIGQQRLELHVAPVDGSEPATRLSHEMPLGRSIEGYVVSRDGRYAVYRSDHEAAGVFDIYSVPVDGSGPPVKVNAPLPSGGNTFEPPRWFDVTRDSRYVVYVAEQAVDGKLELHGVPIAGGVPVRLNPPLPAGGDVLSFALAPEGSRVVFRADANVDQVFELFSAPAEGGVEPMRLSRAASSGQNVWAASVSADGTRAIFSAFQEGVFARRLFSVAIDGGGDPLELSGPFVEGGQVSAFEPIEGGRVLYLADPFVAGRAELFSVRADGSGPPVCLSTPPVGQVRSFTHHAAPHATGGTVVYLADQDTLGVDELYAVPVDGSAAAVKVTTAMGPGGEVGLGTSAPYSYRISPDGGRLVYRADPRYDELFELYSVRLDATDAVKLNGALLEIAVGDIIDFEAVADGTVLYRGDQYKDELYELFRVPTDGSAAPRHVNTPLPPAHDVHRFTSSPDGNWVVYTDLVTITSVPIGVHGAPLVLTSEVGVFPAMTFSPDSQWLVWQDGVNVRSAPVDGSGLDVRLNAPAAGSVDEFQVTLQSDRVVYTADQDVSGRIEIYSVPIDGSDPPVKLNAAVVPGGDVAPGNFQTGRVMQVTPDGTRVVFRGDLDTNDVWELYSAPIDASMAAVKLNDPMVEGGDIGTSFCTCTPGPRAFLISPDGRRVIYRADQDDDDNYELYSVPPDRSLEPVKLNPPFFGGRTSFEFDITADSARVVYIANQETGSLVELFSAPLDGDALPVKLNGPLIATGDVSADGGERAFLLSPDGRQVVYLADALQNEVFELFCVPTDGSSPAVRISFDHPGNQGDVAAFRFSPDGTHVVYQADHRLDEIFELYSVPLDGSLPPFRVGTPGGPTGAYAITPDSSHVLYLGDLDGDRGTDLYSSTIRAARRGGPRREP